MKKKKRQTEAELVGINDAMIFIMWAQYFFQEKAKDLPDM